MQPKVSIIILNYNGKRFNKDCLESVLNQNYQDFEIIFVDNASTDGSIEEVEQLFKNEIKKGKITVIKNSSNTGFTGGNNIGVKNSNSDSEYIWLLNNDIIADKDALKYLIDGIENNSNIGATGSMVLDKGNEDFLTNTIFKDNNKFISTFFGEIAIIKASEREISSKIYNVPSISGCSFLYRKNLIKYPFPDFYFAYGEDVWLSFFILLKGKLITYNTNSIIHHFGGGTKKSNKKINEFSLFHGNKNQIINYLVLFDFLTILKLFPLFLLTQLGHIFFDFSLIRIKSKTKSIYWIFLNYKKVITLRKFVKNNKLISNKIYLANLSYKIADENIISNGYLNKLLIFLNKSSFIYCKVIGLK